MLITDSDEMNVAVVSQARMTSTRLPGKVLKEVGGRPLLYYHSERIRTHVPHFIVATTSNQEDDPIVSFCKDAGIEYYRGDEHDVLGRYFETAQAFDLDVIVRVTSDCPLIDGAKVRQGIDRYLAEAGIYDYLGTGVPEKTYPLGFSFELFSFDLLQKAYANANHPKMREHVTPYMKLQEHPDTELMGCPLEEDWSSYRVTVDTPEDLELVRRLIEGYDVDTMSMEEIVELLRGRPQLQAINSDVHQKKWHE